MSWRSAAGNILISIFFFQAEDGIRDRTVTGVQTCALPISEAGRCTYLARDARRIRAATGLRNVRQTAQAMWVRRHPLARRSEERRVGKECRSRAWPQR